MIDQQEPRFALLQKATLAPRTALRFEEGKTPALGRHAMKQTPYVAASISLPYSYVCPVCTNTTRPKVMLLPGIQLKV